MNSKKSHKTRRALGALITTTALLTLVACGEPTPREVLDQLSQIEFHELDALGTEVKVTSTAGSMLYVLVPKGQRSLIEPAQCHAGAEPFKPSGSSLNVPGDGGEALFAAAEFKVTAEDEGRMQVSCVQPEVQILKLAVDPS